LTYLEITITRNEDNSITITQPTLVDTIIDTANMIYCKGIPTPMSTTQSYNNIFDDMSVD